MTTTRLFTGHEAEMAIREAELMGPHAAPVIDHEEEARRAADFDAFWAGHGIDPKVMRESCN